MFHNEKEAVSVLSVLQCFTYTQNSFVDIDPTDVASVEILVSVAFIFVLLHRMYVVKLY